MVSLDRRRGVYVLKSSKISSEIIVHCHCKLGKRCIQLNSLMVNIEQERNITSIYSFFRHGKHLRKLTTWSRLGPTDSSAKTFTVPRIWVKLCWMTDEHTSSKLEIMLISRRGRRRLLYMKVVVFSRRVAHHCQFWRRNGIDSCWTLLTNYK